MATSKIILTEEQEKEIIDFYLVPNSAREVERAFPGVNLYQLNKLLKKYQINLHSREIITALQTGQSNKTCLERYGVINVAKLSDVQEKIKQTSLKKYGTARPQQSAAVKNKAEQTNLEKYGCKSSAQNAAVKEKVKQTCLDRYGVEYSLQAEENKEKSRKTCLKKYDVDNYAKTAECKDKIKTTWANKSDEELNIRQLLAEQTCLERYGDKSYRNVAQTKQTCLTKYGVDSFSKTGDFIEKSAQTCLDKYGVENYSQTGNYIKDQNTGEIVPGFLTKTYETKKKNGTFNSSKQEHVFYEKLLTYFKSEEIKKQFKSEEYPFACDFYIEPLNLYIELNFMWTHGFHKFNENNDKDRLKLANWQEKAKRSNFYKNALKVWTESDPKKFKAAEENHLNYLVFYTIDDANNWLESLQKGVVDD